MNNFMILSSYKCRRKKYTSIVVFFSVRNQFINLDALSTIISIHQACSKKPKFWKVTLSRQSPMSKGSSRLPLKFHLSTHYTSSEHFYPYPLAPSFFSKENFGLNAVKAGFAQEMDFCMLNVDGSVTFLIFFFFKKTSKRLL